jgi:hypothetical protein
MTMTDRQLFRQPPDDLDDLEGTCLSASIGCRRTSRPRVKRNLRRDQVLLAAWEAPGLSIHAIAEIIGDSVAYTATVVRGLRKEHLLRKHEDGFRLPKRAEEWQATGWPCVNRGMEPPKINFCFGGLVEVDFNE